MKTKMVFSTILGKNVDVPMENDTQHTPGPLAWQRFGDEWCLTGQYGMRPIVLSVGGRPKRGLQLRDKSRDLLIPFNPNHPDAKLLASAPDLLEACLSALDWLRATSALTGNCLGADIQQRLNEAITKATI